MHPPRIRPSQWVFSVKYCSSRKASLDEPEGQQVQVPDKILLPYLRQGGTHQAQLSILEEPRIWLRREQIPITRPCVRGRPRRLGQRVLRFCRTRQRCNLFSQRGGDLAGGFRLRQTHHN
ncbi:hypothetical protein Mapa_015013 [Marchantia paleacea]|nr:hypothetical protein Mapa_015013 [Marchantia paleacea]